MRIILVTTAFCVAYMMNLLWPFLLGFLLALIVMGGGNSRRNNNFDDFDENPRNLNIGRNKTWH